MNCYQPKNFELFKIIYQDCEIGNVAATQIKSQALEYRFNSRSCDVLLDKIKKQEINQGKKILDTVLNVILCMIKKHVVFNDLLLLIASQMDIDAFSKMLMDQARDDLMITDNESETDDSITQWLKQQLLNLNMILALPLLIIENVSSAKDSANLLLFDKFATKIIEPAFIDSRLILEAHSMNNIFQNECEKLLWQENLGVTCQFKRVNVKTMKRSQSKTGLDHNNKPFPRVCRLLDIFRCSVNFKT